MGGRSLSKLIGLELATGGAVPSLSVQVGRLLLSSLRSQGNGYLAVVATAVIFVPRGCGNHGGGEGKPAWVNSDLVGKRRI